MGPKAVRKRLLAMHDRWTRDLDWLHVHIANSRNIDHRDDPGSETVRNLASAIAHAHSFGGMSDEGVKAHMRGVEYDAGASDV